MNASPYASRELMTCTAIELGCRPSSSVRVRAKRARCNASSSRSSRGAPPSRSLPHSDSLAFGLFRRELAAGGAPRQVKSGAGLGSREQEVMGYLGDTGQVGRRGCKGLLMLWHAAVPTLNARGARTSRRARRKMHESEGTTPALRPGSRRNNGFCSRMPAARHATSDALAAPRGWQGTRPPIRGG